MAEDFWEFKDKVKASTMGDESRGEEQGPKMRRSLSCDGLIGIGMEISSSSGRVKRGGEGFILAFLLLVFPVSRGILLLWQEANQ